jgi:DNA polymerase-3 subunit beta
VKFQVEHDALAEAVAWAARMLPTRTPAPVLTGLRIVADGAGADGRITVTASDQAAFGEVELPAVVGEPGVVIVPGRLLAEISKSLPAKPVDVTVSGGRVAIVCGRSRFGVQTIATEEYPHLPELPPTLGEIPGSLLAEAVGQVVVATGREDTLPVLTGIRLEIDGERLVLAATDRYRLAVREVVWTPRRPDASATALAPGRMLADLAKSFGSGPVELGLGEAGLLGVSGPHHQATTRLIDGEFPKYRTLFPAESATVARVETAALIESVRRVALVGDRNTPIRLAFSADQEVTLMAGRGEDAEASESLPSSVAGEGLTIGFNPTFLLDGLNALGAPVTVLSFTVPQRPAVITGAAGLDEPARADYQYLLMPVRLSG